MCTCNKSDDLTHADFVVNHAPALRERDFVAPSGIVELVEFSIGDRSPFDSELANIYLSLRMLVVPPEFMIPYFFGGIVILRVVVTQGNGLRAQGDGRGGRQRGTVPTVRKRAPQRWSEA